MKTALPCSQGIGGHGTRRISNGYHSFQKIRCSESPVQFRTLRRFVSENSCSASLGKVFRDRQERLSADVSKGVVEVWA